MKILMDTHVAIWAISDDPKLSVKAKELLTSDDNDVFYSTISVWEVIIKHMIRPKEVPLDGDLLAESCESTRFRVLPVVNEHTYMIRTLHRPDDAPPHNDPFDRMLIAQAKAENMAFMTHDSLLHYYDEDCIMYI